MPIQPPALGAVTDFMNTDFKVSFKKQTVPICTELREDWRLSSSRGLNING